MKPGGRRRSSGHAGTSTHVAFLRGINMIGRKVVPMSSLAELFSSLGLQGVRTFGASGNILFRAKGSDPAKLTRILEKRLTESLGYEVSVLLRTIPELEEMLRATPFKRERVDRNSKACVTFLPKPPNARRRLPFTPPKQDFKIVSTGAREVFHVRYALGGGRFGDSVAFIEKEYGVPTTTRTWGTVEKIVRLSLGPRAP